MTLFPQWLLPTIEKIQEQYKALGTTKIKPAIDHLDSENFPLKPSQRHSIRGNRNAWLFANHKKTGRQ